jgi:hypothetical protein
MKKTMYTHAPFQFTHQQPYDLHGDAAAAKSIAILSCQALAGWLASTLVTSRFGQQTGFERGILIKKARQSAESLPQAVVLFYHQPVIDAE